jgi:hypothetical protein
MTAWNDLSEQEQAEIVRRSVRLRRIVVAFMIATVVLPAGPVVYSWFQTTWNGQRWLEKATREARKWAPDAELAEMSGEAVDPSGFSDVRSRGGWLFSFRSPSREKLGHSQLVAPGAAPEQPCRFQYRVFPGIRGGFMTDAKEMSVAGCGASLPSGPRCSVAQIWARAVTRGAPASGLASLQLKTSQNGRAWLFEIPNRSTDGLKTSRFQASFADDCE